MPAADSPRQSIFLVYLIIVKIFLILTISIYRGLNLEEYAYSVGSDELIFFVHSKSAIFSANKYMLVSYLIRISQSINFAMLSDYSIFILLKQIVAGLLLYSFYNILILAKYPPSLTLPASIILLFDPFVVPLSFTLLRDDIIIYSFLVFSVGMLYVFQNRDFKRLIIPIILSFILILFTRPQLLFLFAIAFALKDFSFKSLTYKSLIITIMFWSFAMLFLRYEISYALSFLTINPLQVFEGIYLNLLSPAPWNYSTIISSHLSEASYSPIWFLIRFFINMLFPIAMIMRFSTIKKYSLFYKLLKIIFIMLLLLSFVRGGNLIHGPRQGYVLFASLVPVGLLCFSSRVSYEKNSICN
jgi:hypothetical protein